MNQEEGERQKNKYFFDVGFVFLTIQKSVEIVCKVHCWNICCVSKHKGFQV